MPPEVPPILGNTLVRAHPTSTVQWNLRRHQIAGRHCSASDDAGRASSHTRARDTRPWRKAYACKRLDHKRAHARCFALMHRRLRLGRQHHGLVPISIILRRTSAISKRRASRRNRRGSDRRPSRRRRFTLRLLRQVPSGKISKKTVERIRRTQAHANSDDVLVYT